MWFAAWGLLITGGIVLCGLLFMGATFLHQFIHPIGIGSFAGDISAKSGILGILFLLITAAITTGIVILHGTIIRRVTLSLFRIYVVAVSFGVGLLSATPLSFSAVSRLNLTTPLTLVLALPIIPILAALLAYFCGLHAADFRARRPKNLNPITPQEYGVSSGN